MFRLCGFFTYAHDEFGDVMEALSRRGLGADLTIAERLIDPDAI
ncbi:hypothetical protein ABZ352_34670 [Streptomyces griseofuscus]